MDKKLYKESLDSIRISDEAVEKAIKRLRGADTVAKVNVMKKTAKKFTAVGALAASIAVILILGTVFFPSVQNQNGAQRAGFSIIANAAEDQSIDSMQAHHNANHHRGFQMAVAVVFVGAFFIEKIGGAPGEHGDE